MRAMQRQIDRLERGLAQRPIRVSGDTSARVVTLAIIDGNTLTSGQLGIKRKASTINETFAADEATMISSGATLPDGVGRAYIWIDGAQVFDGSGNPLKVLVGHDTRSPIAVALGAGEWMAAYSIKIKVGTYGGEDILAYRGKYI
jgi:hypothetical protein